MGTANRPGSATTAGPAPVSAWHLAGCFRAICAVSVGTALTIDVVDCDGLHRGGLIAPGPTLMLQSLLRDTAGIAPRAAASAAARRRAADATGTLGILATGHPSGD